jgi:uncharacterized protein (DUF983 family)
VPRTPKLRALWRGLSKRCPRCGQGGLFDGWFRARERCSSCGLLFEASPGSVWAFWVVGDRVFVVLALLPFYLTIPVPDPGRRALLCGLVLIPLILTMPNRLGLARGLDFLWRLSWGDPNEPEPPSAAT